MNKTFLANFLLQSCHDQRGSLIRKLYIIDDEGFSTDF